MPGDGRDTPDEARNDCGSPIRDADCCPSDELLLAIENERKGPVSAADFFATPKACLRASPLVKKHGFGLHHDAEGKVALVSLGSKEYERLLATAAVEKRPGMRSARG